MYTIRLKLELCNSEKRFFDKCFFFTNKIHNQLVSYAQQSELYSDKEYRDAKKEYGESGFSENENKLTEDQKQRKQELTDILKKKVKEYHLQKKDLTAHSKKLQKKYKNYLVAHQVQHETNDVYRGVQNVLYGDGKKLHYKTLVQSDCIKQKDNESGVKVKNTDFVLFKDHIYKIANTKKNNYAKAQLKKLNFKKDIVSTYIKRIEFNSGYHYYVLINIDKPAPKRIRKCKAKNRTGIDLGISTIATVSKKEVSLVELAPKSKKYDKQISHLKKLVSRSMRINNPGNYNKNKTIKKGNHQWIVTKKCKKMKRMIRVLYRKQTAYVQASHQKFINHLIQTTNELILEPMNFKALQKKRKHHRFGHSIQNHSPGFMQSELKRKAEQYDVPYFEINPFVYKASQLHHDTGEYIKPKLSERFKIIDGHKVQRDLYSAFLICNTSDSLTIPDFDLCNSRFPRFVEMHDTLIENMKKRGISMKQCFGF